MAHAFYHAKSSARRFGGKPEDYLALHLFMDHTKDHLADARHRLVLHNTWGIALVVQFFGTTITRVSDGKQVPTRTVLEQHVLEDLGRIPTLEQCMSQVTLAPWMHRNAEPLSKSEEADAATEQTTSFEAVAGSSGTL